MITKKKQAAIVVLDMPLLDMWQGKDLTGVLIADSVLQFLSYVAQIAREFIRQRQVDGIAAAKTQVVRFRRSPKLLPENEHGTYQRREVQRDCGDKGVWETSATFRYRAEIYKKVQGIAKEAILK